MQIRDVLVCRDRDGAWLRARSSRSNAVEGCLRPQRIDDQLIVVLGQVFQRERSAEAALSNGGENPLETEDALRMSERQMLLP